MLNLEELRAWYNGYQIGASNVYNPCSVMSFLEEGVGVCRNFSFNTSNNDLISDLILQADSDTQKHLEILMEGGLIQANAMVKIAFRDPNGHALWSFLLHSGYLTIDHESRVGFRPVYNLRIPNREALELYQTIISKVAGHHRASSST